MIDLGKPLVAGEDIASNIFQGKHIQNVDVNFRWKPVEKAQGYSVKVYKDPKGRDLIYEKEVANESTTLRNDNLLKNKQYYQVFANLPGGFVATSKVGSVGFDFLPPTLAFPRDRSLFNIASLQQQNNQILFTWRKTNFTVSYEFEISNSPRFDRVLVKATPSANFTVLRTKLAKGTYYWRVRSIGRGVKSDPSGANAFTVQ
jgi:hypothetical protein